MLSSKHRFMTPQMRDYLSKTIGGLAEDEHQLTMLQCELDKLQKRPQIVAIEDRYRTDQIRKVEVQKKQEYNSLH